MLLPLFLISGVLAQEFERLKLPPHVGLLRDQDELPRAYPSASSGVSRGGGPQIAPQSQHHYPPPQVAEVDSVDFLPHPSAPAVQPEFSVLQPPDFSRGLPRAPQPPQPTYPEPSYPEEIPSRPAPAPQPPTAPAGPEKPSNAYEINYCDKGEFPDDVLLTYGLERVDYFVWNTTCSTTFFQCSIGHTFLLRCSSDDQAFDRSTVNCNFKNAVKVCPEYDHVMHCTIRESCNDMQYACCALPQQCLPLERRCDGHADCADGDDENNCPSCARDEFACVQNGRCIPAEQRCDGVKDDCGDGTNLDEIGCDKNSTCVGKFMCDQSRVGVTCVDWTQHCDGLKDCYNGEDEINCRQGGEAKYLLCENQKQSVTKLQWCNGEADCADASDEKYCY